MWRALAGIDEDAWRDAIDMPGAQVAVSPYKPAGWPADTVLLIRRVRLDPDQVSADPRSRRRRTLRPAPAGAADPRTGARTGDLRLQFHLHQHGRVHPGQGRRCEHWYRHRTVIENIFRDSKHGAALRHLPSGSNDVNTAWMFGSLIAAAIAAWVHQLTGTILGAELVAGHGTRDGKAMIATLRRKLIAIPARLVRHGGQPHPAPAPGAPLLPASSPPSAHCPHPASRSRSPRDRQASPAPRPQATAPRPRTSRKPQTANPARVPGHRHVPQPGLTTPRSSTGLWITPAALLVDSGQITVPDFAKLTMPEARPILHTADLIRGAAVTVPWEGITIHVHPGTATPGDIFQALVYRELRLAVGETQASLGYEQIHLPAARVDPGSVTRHGDHDDIRIVPVGETPAVIRYRAA